jgi:hypothetical protein
MARNDLKPSPDITLAAAVDAVLATGLSGPCFNSYNFGGYLIFRGLPVFIDGRGAPKDFFQSYLDAIRLKTSHSLPDLLEKYKIQWTLLVPGEPAVALMDYLPGWRRLYTDDYAVVHVRTAS